MTTLGCLTLILASSGASAQLLRGALDGGTTGSGGVLGTGLTVGTTGPGSGVLGTGLNVGTTGSGGVLGTGLNVGTTGPGDGLLGTGLTLRTNGGSAGPGTPCDPCGPGRSGSPAAGGSITVSQSQSVTNELRLSNAASAVATNNGGAYAAAGATGSDSLAVGYGSAASGSNAVAIGGGASAGQSNTVAVGYGARTTRDNQIVIGTAGNTYTLPGVTSAASAAAQSGPTQFVTTDAAGNLAASPYGPASIGELGNRVGAVESRVDSLESKTAALARYTVETRREARQGVATALAMTSASMPSAPGRTTWVANSATYRGEWAGGVGVAHRLPTCCVAIALTAGVSYGGNNSVGARAGLAGEF